MRVGADKPELGMVFGSDFVFSAVKGNGTCVKSEREDSAVFVSVLFKIQIPHFFGAVVNIRIEVERVLRKDIWRHFVNLEVVF